MINYDWDIETSLMKACFLGLGYIGLPTAIISARNGIDVSGTDIDSDIVNKTNSGLLHIVEPELDVILKEVVSSGKLRAYTTPQPSDAYFIVVPTPFCGDTHEPDVSYVEAATESVIPLLKEGDLFVIESTSPVGTTERMRDRIFAARPELTGKIFIAYCPERVLPGNIVSELINNDRVIGGIDSASTEKAKEFYSLFVKGRLHSTDSRTAEMCKLTENASRDVQIAFANELSMICEKAGINVWELISLANRHPRVNILQPGCGVGGHCIAVDPYFITSSYPEESKLIAEARAVNVNKAQWCIERIRKSVEAYMARNGRMPRIAVMGLAFKPDIDDLRESPAVVIASAVADEFGNSASFVEPNIECHARFALTDYRKAYSEADIVVFLVNHKEFHELDFRSDVETLDFCGTFKN